MTAMKSIVVSTLLLAVFYCCSANTLAAAAAADNNNNNNNSQSKQVVFQGRGSARRQIRQPPGSQRTFPDFLAQRQHDRLLIGSQDVKTLPNGDLDCQFESFGLFGFRFAPVFRASLSRHRDDDDIVLKNNGKTTNDQGSPNDASAAAAARISVSLIEGRTELLKERGEWSMENFDNHNQQEQRSENWLSSILQLGWMNGGSEIRAMLSNSPYSTNSHSGHENATVVEASWDVSLDSSLDFHLNLPKRLPLPRGFDRIGSFFMQGQTQHRAAQSLADIHEAYVAWATGAVP